MKIKRFFAKDMRAALAQVKETLGADAVIMSNKKVTGGIEIVAAVDYDEPVAKPIAQGRADNPFGQLSDDKVSLAGQSAVRARAPKPSDMPADSLQALLERQQNRMEQQMGRTVAEEDLPEWARELAAQSTNAKPQSASAKNQARQAVFTPTMDKNPAANRHQIELDAMKEELSSLRNLLTHQVSSLMKDQKKRTDPMGAMLESRLLAAEFSPAVATKLAGLSQHYSPVELVKTLPQSLANMLDNQGDDIVHRGGVVAFVGPTGVGKTTSIAKLAARFAAKHGTDQVAFITTDHYRIGAFEQLATYGKIMGCPVKQVHDLNELQQTLYQLRNRKLVLIDTAGMGQRDTRLVEQLDNLTANSALPIRSYLVLSATAQRRVNLDAVKHFQRIPLSGVVLTKLDESVSLAGALSVLIQSGLPLSYVTNGQRVPEDMNVADTLALAKQALDALNQSEHVGIGDIQKVEDAKYAFE